MQENRVRKVAILGGGSSGWMAAAMLAKVMGPLLEICLVESEDIGTVGVGEATIPPIQLFNGLLGLDEADFLTQTLGSIKLGIQFEGWGKPEDSYMHAFGDIGQALGLTPFHQFWLKARSEGDQSDFWDYSLNYQAAKAGRFIPLERIPDSSLKGLVHAYHFDAGLYAQMLRRFSEGKGVKRIEGKVKAVPLEADGSIAALVLEDGKRVEADLFIDCSGFRALLIEGALKAGFEAWSHWLPCDRALAVPSRNDGDPRPYTRSIAHKAGWQWQIPLQHRTGNGLVYCSQYLGDDEAAAILLAGLDGEPLAEPRLIRFQIGRRRQQWVKNCVSLGLSSGFLEPLESTSLHMVQSGIIRLIKHFPRAAIHDAEVAEFNRQSMLDFEYIRDFIILHYHLNQRVEPFWRDRREMAVPDTLKRRLALFAASGRVFREQDELFSEVAWYQVLLGQNLMPVDRDPLADALGGPQLKDFLDKLRNVIRGTCDRLPRHGDFLRRAQQLAKGRG
ncbi:tryptophan 7-halogenase [Gallaecimonas kandeliae]|uniref:tryptophan halogenase family protein n=1 Tax=Gallaecimonas kandeliae TaxID=3029055 RepID=UPI0026487933|nr:tryptophan halogenase family protein [Gallaecimonas kandeliae]WKE66581.1 tryptophan 7-halogenase [Gallaecimonas kandeliae]